MNKLLKEWSPKNKGKLEDYSLGSHKKMIWICECSNEWKAEIRQRKRLGCPKCRKSNLLIDVCPELFKEYYDKIDFKKITYASNKKYLWKCLNGHIFEMSAYHRTCKGSDCHYCSDTRFCEENSLVNKTPELLESWDFEKNLIDPKFIKYNSTEIFYWKCKKNHSWQSPINNRQLYGCSFCAGKKVLKEESVGFLFPNLLKEWNDEKDPFNYLPKSDVIINWECCEGHTWNAIIKNRTKGSGCPSCHIKRSNSADQWLNENNVPIREYYLKINNKKYYVDGFNPKTNTVYEYFGNFWHGNPEIYELNDINPVSKKTYGELYQKTMNKIKDIERAGFNLIYKWEE